MATDVPSLKTKLYVAFFGLGLLAASGGVAWLLCLAIETGRISVRSGVVTRAESPIRFSIEIVLGVFSVLVIGGASVTLLVAVVRANRHRPAHKGKRRF